MKLTKDQRKRLHEALLDAFPTQAILAKLLSFELDVNLAVVAGNGPLDGVVLNVIEWADSQGRTEDLINAARATVPLNTLLQEVASEILSQDDETTSGLSLEALLQWLPVADDKLFGREEELEWLDKCFHDPLIRVVVLTAFGGVGKTALVRHWLKTRFGSAPPNSPRFVFIGCSFFSQGTRDRAGTSDQFLYDSLKLLGDPDPTKGSAWIRAKRLATYASREPTILVLDGVEPLQYGIGRDDLEGRFKDPGIRELLANLASSVGHAFCIVTSRLDIDEPFLKGASSVQKPLDLLSDESAERILRYRGVRGIGSDFKKAIAYLGHHPLALVLAAEYLNTFEGGEVARIKAIPLISEETRGGRHAKSVMAAYETAFIREGNLLDTEVLKIFGLFDRPINWAWIEALSVPPMISGFSKFGSVETTELKECVKRLRKWGLLSKAAEQEALDSHPLIREYFGSKFKTENVVGWKDANKKLYEYYRREAVTMPDTVEAMDPLLLAVVHGCRSSNYSDALENIYVNRIMRGDEAYAAVTLNLIGPLLAVLAQFFENKNWLQPIKKSSKNPQGLDIKSQVFVLGQVGYFIMATRGYATSEVEEIFRLAHDLSLEVNDKPKVFQSKYGLWRYYSAKGDLKKSLNEANGLLLLAQEVQCHEYNLAARRAMATSLYRVGEFQKSLENAIEGVNIVQERNPPERLQADFGEDPGVNCQCFAAMALWHLGYPKQARQMQHQALENARQSTGAHERAVAFYLGSYVYDFCREYEKSQIIAEEMIEVSSEYGFKWWLAAGLIRRGWALSMLGNFDDGIVALKDGLSIWRSTGSGIGLPYWNSLLAEVLLQNGRYLEAGSFVDQALFSLNKNNERWWEPELYRLKGQILLEQAISEDEAQECFRKAIELSKERCDNSLHLRAAKSFSNYLYGVGQTKEALELITEAFEVFEEGLETQDLIEARQLITSFS